MPWPQHLHQARPISHRVRNYAAGPYPRPSARASTEGSRVRVSGSGSGFAARLCGELVRTPLAGTGAYTLTTPNAGVNGASLLETRSDAKSYHRRVALFAKLFANGGAAFTDAVAAPPSLLLLLAN